jgi:hypothetical protein
MSKKTPLLGVMLGFILLLSACSSKPVLPAGYTVANIQTALEDYINERLWLYPESAEGKGTNVFEAYVGQSLKVDVRLYPDTSGQKVYAHTNIGDWLAVLQYKAGTVYCDGQVSPDSQDQWPGEHFETGGSFEITVQPPHEPEYGTSPRKEKVLAAMEERATVLCEDLSSGSEAAKWTNTKLYIADFHKYLETTSAWFLRPDGYVWSFGFSAEEENGLWTGSSSQGRGAPPPIMHPIGIISPGSMSPAYPFLPICFCHHLKPAT